MGNLCFNSGHGGDHGSVKGVHKSINFTEIFPCNTGDSPQPKETVFSVLMKLKEKKAKEKDEFDMIANNKAKNKLDNDKITSSDEDSSGEQL